MYWMEPTRRAPEFPNPWHSSPERGEKQMIYYRRGPISFQVSFARSKRGNRSKGGVNAASTKYIYRHTDIQTSLETIFRIFRIFVDPFLSACNFVKFCFSISGIGCLVTDLFFPFFELDQAPLLLLVAEKKKKFSRFVPLIGQKHTQGNNDPRSIIYNIFNRTSYIYVYIGVSYMYNRANRFLITIKWSKNWRGGRGGVININRQNGSGSKMMRVNLKISQRSFPSLSREKKGIKF